LLAQSDQTPPNLDPSDLDKGVIVPWHVKTKYYETDLAFWILQASNLPNSTAEPSFSMEEWEMISSVVDAFIFIASNALDVTMLKEWNELLQNDEPSIKLCVVDSSDQAFVEQVQDTCFDLMFEVVNLQEEPTHETAGLGRLIEALQSHEWPVKQAESAEAQDVFEQLFSKLDQEDGFEEAVSQLQSIRQRAHNAANDEDRRQIAESVALAFEKFIQLETTAPTAAASEP